MTTGKMILRSVLAVGMASLPLYAAHAAPTDQRLQQGATQLESLFASLDADHSGDISMKEYMAYHHRTVDPKFSEYFEFRAMDADDNERISKIELRNATDPFDPKL